jgi:hypothetical protein
MLSASSRQFLSLFLNSPPGVLHVPFCCIGLPDAQAQRDFVVQPRVREMKIATAVKRVQQALVGIVATLQAKAN